MNISLARGRSDDILQHAETSGHKKQALVYTYIPYLILIHGFLFCILYFYQYPTCFLSNYY